MRPHILNAEPGGYAAEARATLASFAEVDEAPLDRAQLLQRIADYDALIVRLGHQIDAELLERAPRLKAVATATTGLNHVDLDAACRNGVTVLCLKGERAFLETVTATAEHAWGLLLALIRHIPAAHEHVLAGGWDRDSFTGIELAGRTLGVIGLGRLGSKVARYGRAFGMQVLANDPHVHSAEDGVRLVPLEGLLRHSDVISLHVPHDESTGRMIGDAEFRMTKPGACLINTARGQVVDEKALLAALEDGRLAAAALDVMTGENSGDPEWVDGDRLVAYARTHDNLILTPHLGGATVDSLRKAETLMARKLKFFFYGK